MEPVLSPRIEEGVGWAGRSSLVMVGARHYTKIVPAGHGGTLAPPCEFTLFHRLGVDSGGDTDTGN